MFENYVCKIYVSNDPHFSSHLEATAFGFDNGQQQKILTAALLPARRICSGTCYQQVQVLLSVGYCR